MFKEAEDFLDGIATVQQDNKVRISSMQPALPMLDLHGVTRADIHASLFRTMQDKLLLKVGSLENKGLTKLLDRCFRYIGAEKELQSVCLRIMEQLPSVDSKYLSHIADNHDLYAACPLEVKRQIWQGNQGLFGEAVSPLLDQYVAEKEAVLSFVAGRESTTTTTTTIEGRTMMMEGGKLTSFLSLPPKARRQSPIVQELVSIVGSSQTLYSTLLQFLRTLYLRTHVSHYCTLRADVLMSLHDAESPICSTDRCYKFAWCLDACVRVGHVDEKKGRELYSFLEGIVGGDEILADLAMLLRDPYALHVICKSTLNCLGSLCEASKLPRESAELESLVRLLQLSQQALALVDSKEYYEEKLDAELMVKFLPCLLSLVAENALRGVLRQLKEDHAPFSLPAYFTHFISHHGNGMHLACTYALDLLERRDVKSFTLLLPSIAKAFNKSDNSVNLPDLFLHLLVLKLAQQREVLREATLLVILRDFWVPCSQSSEHVLLYLFHMLWFMHSAVGDTLLREVLETVEPGKESTPTAQEQYQALLDHIQNTTSNRL